MAHKCIACTKKDITWNFAICTDCEKIYGNSALQWPAWLRFLWADEQKQRRRTVARAKYEVSMPTDSDI